MSRATQRNRVASDVTAPPVAVHGSASEHAADRAVDRLMAGQTPAPLAPAGTTGTAAIAETARSRAAAVAESPGEPLPAAERAYFEPRFGRDLSVVRLHCDAEAGAAAQGVGAAAFAHRNHIAFAPGAFAPETVPGRHRLAHEIAHTLQQGRDGPDLIQRDPPRVNPEIANLPANRYVDAYREVEYDLDYRAVGGNLSTWLRVTYSDGAQIDIDIYDIADRDISMIESMAHGHLGPRGRIFPEEMTRTTVPRLWAARQEAIRIMEEYNFQFMMASMPAVIFILSMTGSATPAGGGSGAVRRTTRLRPRPRTPIPSAPATAAETATPGAAGGAATAAASGPGSAAAGSSFRLLSSRVLRYSGRDIVVVETSSGPQAFYRRTGLGGSNAGGAQAGEWAPFDGILAGWFDKSRYVTGSADDVLFRFGTQENRAASQWLNRQGIGAGEEVGEVWSMVNQFLENLGALRVGGGG